jgi:hypothetical protein
MSALPARRARLARLAVGLVCVTLVGGAALVSRAQGPTPAAMPATPPSDTVKITLLTVPPAKRVLVFWGKKRLGIIAPKAPLILQRPRDSGPMDLILQSEGYLSVQTRAFTFGDTKVTVKLTPLDQKNTLLGYRQELPPDELADGGVLAAPEAGGSLAPEAGVHPLPDAGGQ